MQDHTDIINRLTPFVNGLGKAVLRELDQYLNDCKFAYMEGYENGKNEARDAELFTTPVGKASYMPGTEGFTMVCFKASDVPADTELFVINK